MIDSGTTGNFMIKRYAKNKKYSIQDKQQSYRLVSLNDILLGNDSGWISTETISLPVIFQKYYEELMFDIVDMASYNIVLGIL